MRVVAGGGMRACASIAGRGNATNATTAKDITVADGLDLLTDASVWHQLAQPSNQMGFSFSSPRVYEVGPTNGTTAGPDIKRLSHKS